MPHRRNSAIAVAALLMLASCGGDGGGIEADAVRKGNTGQVAAKAVADVDAAMADARQAPSASPGQ